MPALDDQRRDAAADLLKGVAIVLMIQVHIAELFAQPAILESWIGKVSLLLGGPPVAPVFMVVMGYFAGRSQKTTGSLVVRGCILFVLGFALNLGRICHLLLRIYWGDLQVDPWPYVFGVDILLLAGLSLIVVGLLKPLIGFRPWPWLGAAAVVVIVSPMAHDALTVQDARKWFFAFAAGDYWWSYFPLVPWLAYPFLGVAVRLWKEHRPDGTPSGQSGRTRWVSRLLCGSLLVLALALTLPGVITICHDLPQYYHHDSWFFLWLCVFLLVWVRLFQTADRLFGRFWPFRWIKWMGRHVTVLYVIQWLIIANIATGIYKTQGIANCVLWAVFVLAVANLLTWVWTKFFPRGQPPERLDTSW